MRIVVATGIYPPEIGGPALYAFNLKKAFESQGHSVAVIRYGALKKLPSGARHLLYACKLLPYAFRADAIIAFDTYSVGVPAAAVSVLTRTQLLVRVGGDFLWERYVENTGDLIPLSDIYRHREKWGIREKIIFFFTRFCVARSVAAFNTQWLLDIWREAYGLDSARAHVIENEMEPCTDLALPQRKNFLFYSRQTPLKNHAAFRRAFEQAKRSRPDIELEEGMISHEELMQKVKSCYAVVVPSVSDVAPNYVLDALRFGKPFLLTKYSGYAEPFKEYGVIVNPLDEADMARGIEELAKPEVYERLSRHAATFNKRHTFDDIAREFLALLHV